MGIRCPKDPFDPVEPIEFDKLHLNPPFCTHILQKNLLLILILGLRPHTEPIETTLTRPLKNPRVVNPRELKPREKRIPCNRTKFWVQTFASLAHKVPLPMIK